MNTNNLLHLEVFVLDAEEDSYEVVYRAIGSSFRKDNLREHSFTEGEYRVWGTTTSTSGK